VAAGEKIDPEGGGLSAGEGARKFFSAPIAYPPPHTHMALNGYYIGDADSHRHAALDRAIKRANDKAELERALIHRARLISHADSRAKYGTNWDYVRGRGLFPQPQAAPAAVASALDHTDGEGRVYAAVDLPQGVRWVLVSPDAPADQHKGASRLSGTTETLGSLSNNQQRAASTSGHCSATVPLPFPRAPAPAPAHTPAAAATGAQCPTQAAWHQRALHMTTPWTGCCTG
jgi:hypothetical protein